MNSNIVNLVSELNELDRQLVYVEGRLMKPSQCFRYETDPLHYLFNTNCPDELKQQVRAIFKKYTPSDESGSSTERVG